MKGSMVNERLSVKDGRWPMGTSTIPCSEGLVTGTTMDYSYDLNESASCKGTPIEGMREEGKREEGTLSCQAGTQE